MMKLLKLIVLSVVVLWGMVASAAEGDLMGAEEVLRMAQSKELSPDKVAQQKLKEDLAAFEKARSTLARISHE